MKTNAQNLASKPFFQVPKLCQDSCARCSYIEANGTTLMSDITEAE